MARDIYSFELPGTAEAHAGGIRRNALNQDSQASVHGCWTAFEALRRGARVSGDRACLGWRPADSRGTVGPFVFLSYDEVTERIDAIHAGLVHRQLLPPSEATQGLQLLALYSKNKPEWILAEHACYAMGAATVPLYDTLGPDTVEFILRQTAAPACLCGSGSEVDRTLEAAKQCPALRTILAVDEPNTAQLAKAVEIGVLLVALDVIESEGRGLGAAQPKHAPPSPDDVATFCYTSGTTGEPKGALISHRNLMAACAGVQLLAVHAHIPQLGPEDVHLSYLPLPHVFERCVVTCLLASGSAVGFYQGDPAKLVEDLLALRPTSMPSVPRVLNRFFDKITAGVAAAGGLKKQMFDRAMADKLAGLRHGQLKHWLWDAVLFNKIKAGLGLDRVRLMVTGSAPISGRVLDFFRCLLGVQVYEGYGQTEGSAVCTLTLPDDFDAGTVGAPMPNVEVRLFDVPEMGYLHTDTAHSGVACQGRGEICYRGPTVFQGYFKNPGKSAEAIDDQGWLHSGDVGLWTPKGQLKIIDRKKNIFKLSQGEYIAAEKIENVLMQSPLVAQAFVYGDSLQSFLVAVLVPDAEAAALRFPGLDSAVALARACADAASPLSAAVRAEVSRVSAEAQLQRFEVVRAVHLSPEPFTVEDGTLTPTFKLRRTEAKAKFMAHIDAMYARPPPPIPPAGSAKL